MYRKTRSSIVVTDIHEFGHETTSTNVLFIEDTWAGSSEKQSAYVPSNIEKGQMVTHLVDNVDRKNKSINGDETCHTNSITI